MARSACINTLGERYRQIYGQKAKREQKGMGGGVKKSKEAVIRGAEGKFEAVEGERKRDCLTHGSTPLCFVREERIVLLQTP